MMGVRKEKWRRLLIPMMDRAEGCISMFMLVIKIDFLQGFILHLKKIINQK